MKKFFRGILGLILWIWQMPQQIAGFCLMFSYLRKGRINRMIPYESAMVFRVSGFPGGLSLGKYIFVEMLNYDLIRHEYGHSRQSKIFGWLYLVVFGLPSLIWCKCYKSTWKKSYYWFYTEKFADYLGGVKRIKNT